MFHVEHFCLPPAAAVQIGFFLQEDMHQFSALCGTPFWEKLFHGTDTKPYTAAIGVLGLIKPLFLFTKKPIFIFIPVLVSPQKHT